MKIRKKALAVTGSVIAAASILSGCIPNTVYGPPPVSEPPTPAVSSQPEETPAPAVSFQPEDNVPVCLYGPPPTSPAPVSAPEDNLPTTVYGPPSFFEKD